ncbi:hypothetical protein GH714_008806 [Hevea brasiliensis]|uniref:Uncharacterized protein n=1 Tax=Hevea brasiliensis TaxID=3981 RepID=A0A6A6N254_HEVBR|nr:hypothetical protein GH714_008806 [Hevea brasiliensis]
MLLGYCAEIGERLLVYEFMPHGTLRDHLHGALSSGLELGGYFEFEALNIGYWVWLQDGLELGDKVHFVNLSRVNNVQLEVRRLVGSLWTKTHENELRFHSYFHR